MQENDVAYLNPNRMKKQIQTLLDRQGLREPTRRGPANSMGLAQMFVLCWIKQLEQYPTWKGFWQSPICRSFFRQFKWASLSYSRLMGRLAQIRPLLLKFVQALGGKWAGFGAVDSTLVPLGKLWLARGKSAYKALKKAGNMFGHGSCGPMFGAKLHVLSNALGQIVAFAITPGSHHDLAWIKMGSFDAYAGVVLGDSGYRSAKLCKKLQSSSVALWARPTLVDIQQFNRIQKGIYRARESVEGVFSLLKQRFNLVPGRSPRTWAMAQVHILSSLLAYAMHPNKPNIQWQAQWLE